MKITREQVLDKAREHFARSGFRKTSLAAIARDLGVVKGALYYHVPGGKKEMLDACMRQIEDDFEAAMTKAAAGHDDPADALRAAVRAKLGVIEALRGQFDLSQDISEEIKVLIASEEREYHRREIEFFSRILDRGVEIGKFRDVTPRKTVAEVIQAIVRHFEIRDVFVTDAADRIGELTLDLVLDGLRRRY